jgi:AcrR family transcriptional regulator
LRAAFRLVTRRGYPDVTTEQIAKHAKASKQTLYRWWSSKAALVLDALAENGSRTVDASQARAIERGDLEAFLRATFRALRISGPTLRHLMAEAQNDDELRGELVARLVEPRRETLRRLLGKSFTSPAAREAAVSAVFGAMWYRLLLDEPLDAAFAGALAAIVRRTH